MAGANSNIQMTDLDFSAIKNNLKTFLQSQDVLKDYNYDGSALNILLDVLAYNTQYNAYYLNMVANEMFLDSALLRNSVVSQAKLLGYTPKSVISSEAVINLTFNQVNDYSLTLPKFTSFMSESIDGVNYNFVTVDSTTVNVTNNQAVFNNITIKQGEPGILSYTVNETQNPTFTFKITTPDVDTSTIQVLVQESSTNSFSQIYNLATDYLTLNNDSLVYFLQESLNSYYEIYFGDGLLGKKLVDGNIVRISYISTAGPISAGANSFVLLDSVNGYANNTITPVTSANKGAIRESISSIKYQAPKNYSAQNRAVSKEDYINAIQKNKLGYSFDGVNVWGGQENDPPVYGQVFVCLKPAGAYTITPTQKQRLIEDVIKPISVMTVVPTIVDPDYTYVQLTTNVYYDPKKTTLTSSQLKDNIKTAILNLASSKLNTFQSTFTSYDYNTAINRVDPSIITNEININLQKKINTNLTGPTTYKLFYGAPLEKGIFQTGVVSSPGLSYRNPLNLTEIIEGVFIEEVPSLAGGVESISIINKGFGYSTSNIPTVTIEGDGTGATAKVIMNQDGSIKSIQVLTKGENYTSAIATITAAAGDTTGKNAAAVVTVEGQYGTLRTYYNNTKNVKTIFDTDIGTIDYKSGLVTLSNFNPQQVANDLGQLTITAKPTTSIISSTYNRIVTIDVFDPNSVVVNVIAKTT
jgi:hypothetical protein